MNDRSQCFYLLLAAGILKNGARIGRLLFLLALSRRSLDSTPRGETRGYCADNKTSDVDRESYRLQRREQFANRSRGHVGAPSRGGYHLCCSAGGGCIWLQVWSAGLQQASGSCLSSSSFLDVFR